MTTTINAKSTGIGGLDVTCDASGSLELQTGGVAALTIDTSQRTAFVAGTAAAPAITRTGDTNTGMFFPAADTIAFAEGGTEAMRLDASGNVGIGTTSPNARLTINDTNKVTDSFGLISVLTTDSQAANLGGQIGLGGAWNGTTQTVFGAIAGRKETSTNAEARGYLQFSTLNNSVQERMRVNTNGNLLIGTTTEAANETPLVLSKNSGTTRWSVGPFASVPTNFYITATSAAQGVFLNGSSATSWSALSDERTKDIIEPIENAVEKVSTLRAVIGKYKSDDENNRKAFLIAQDVQAVLPEAVSVANPETGHLGLAYTDVIPLLVAAIKEQQTIINDLKARIETLESK